MIRTRKDRNDWLCFIKKGRCPKIGYLPCNYLNSQFGDDSISGFRTPSKKGY